MEEVIDLASNSEFSNFSKKVKQSLEDKLRNNATIKDNASKTDKFTDMANKFKEIAGVGKTEVEPVKTEEPAPAPAVEEPTPAEPAPEPVTTTEDPKSEE